MVKNVLRIVGVVIVTIIISVIVIVNFIVNSSTSRQHFDDVNAVPKNKVGLLLGTAKYHDKSRQIINTYYQNRIDAAVALYMSGKVDIIIVSGDNSTQYYNEPLLMKNDLIAKGVPASHIIMDNAGFRTLDSILRCRDIFGQKSFTIISQEFHNQRALYIANHKGLSCVAFNAPMGETVFREMFREKLARVKMMLDLINNKQASFYGEKIEVK